MAAFPVGHSLHTTHNNPLRQNRPTPRAKFSLCCRSHLPSRPTGNSEEKMETKGSKSMEQKRWWRLLFELYGEVGKVGRELKKSLSPKQKGDWKDLILMCFSFAVYVYISQKIVCAYCAWVSMNNRF
ncbi:hypothetical protein COCNU_13G007720 [Cocos nucifera]|uniref:Uncharacterized protein n=1 Tax=Cocos nucifera TaxID=13894 RepID=A0A8K0ITK8_COCNU|nr:hypothetical protein COCNU_13G007720 [Cocos nucifera]